jgi:hypothetical protein
MPDEDQETLPATSIESTPQELLNRKPLDFSATIARLEQRAVAARKRARWAGYILILGAYGVLSVLIYNLFRGDDLRLKFNIYTSENRQSVEAPLARRVAHIVNS